MRLFKYKVLIKKSISKEEYLKKLIDNYGDIERAKEEYEFYSDVLDNYNELHIS